MQIVSAARSRIKRARARGSRLVRLLDRVRLALTAEGRGLLWTSIMHGAEVHQTSGDTREDRYPELMSLAARLRPDAARILSFGCSTGEEIVTLGRHFPSADIVGAEINARSRRIAMRRLAQDDSSVVVAPDQVGGTFDIIFALAVLQREPGRIKEMQVDDISSHYPFDRFDKAISNLVSSLEPGGLLCVFNAHYPVETATAFCMLESLAESPLMEPPLFGRNGRILSDPQARTIFRKRA